MFTLSHWARTFTCDVVVLCTGARCRGEEYVGLVVVFLHAGVSLAVAALGVPPCAERAPRLPPTPARREALLPAEVLPKHQIHLGKLPTSFSFALKCTGMRAHRSHTVISSLYHAKIKPGYIQMSPVWLSVLVCFISALKCTVLW